MKKVLILGAGLVSRPIVDYLLSIDDYEVTVASRTVSKAQALVSGHERGRAVEFDISKTPEKLAELIDACDLAVSLLPYTHHVTVAGECISRGKHMVTTSYVSAQMKELDGRAKDAGIIILNELGLDPGIDHMSAMKIIDDVHDRNGKIVSFRSFCGGLPAPEASDNPFGYKFSWSPRGVVMAGANNARFLEDGEIKEIPGEILFKSWFPFKVPGNGEFEAYPNRDSVPYIELYGIPETKTMLRGTLRNHGWCPTWYQMRRMKLDDKQERPHLAGKTYADLTRDLMQIPAGEDLRKSVAEKLDIDHECLAMHNINWLGYFSDDPLPDGKANAFDILVARLEEKLSFKENERDMIVLAHEFIAEFSDGKKEKIHSILVDYGIPGGDSSMARTVSLPAAIGTRMILDGAITLRGVHIPVSKGIYEPVLKELETRDIVCRESVEELS